MDVVVISCSAGAQGGIEPVQDPISSYRAAAEAAAQHVPPHRRATSQAAAEDTVPRGKASDYSLTLAATLPAACAADPDPFLLSTSSLHVVNENHRQLPTSANPAVVHRTSTAAGADAAASEGIRVPDWEAGLLDCEAAVPTHSVFQLPPPLADAFGGAGGYAQCSRIGRSATTGGKTVIRPSSGKWRASSAARLQRQMQSAAAAPSWHAALTAAERSHARKVTGDDATVSLPPVHGVSAFSAEPGTAAGNLVPGEATADAIGTAESSSCRATEGTGSMPARPEGQGTTGSVPVSGEGGDGRPQVVRVDDHPLAEYALRALQVVAGNRFWSDSPFGNLQSLVRGCQDCLIQHWVLNSLITNKSCGGCC